MNQMIKSSISSFLAVLKKKLGCLFVTKVRSAVEKQVVNFFWTDFFLSQVSRICIANCDFFSFEVRRLTCPCCCLQKPGCKVFLPAEALLPRSLARPWNKNRNGHIVIIVIIIIIIVIIFVTIFIVIILILMYTCSSLHAHGRHVTQEPGRREIHFCCF